MVFNIDMCQVVLFDHRGQGDCSISYTLYDTALNFLESFRYLRVTVSGNFK